MFVVSYRNKSKPGKNMMTFDIIMMPPSGNEQVTKLLKRENKKNTKVSTVSFRHDKK